VTRYLPSPAGSDFQPAGAMISIFSSFACSSPAAVGAWNSAETGNVWPGDATLNVSYGMNDAKRPLGGLSGCTSNSNPIPKASAKADSIWPCLIARAGSSVLSRSLRSALKAFASAGAAFAGDSIENAVRASAIWRANSG